MKNITFLLPAFAASICLSAFALLAGIVGCGGKQTAMGSDTRTGRLALTIRWPEQSNSRLIPAASNSIRATLTRGEASSGDQVLARPTTGNQTTVTFRDLPPGGIILSATAFPGADGSGVAQASGAASATIVSGQTAQVTVTMDSTIDRVTITPANPTVTPAASVPLTMTAFDAAGNVVLVAPNLVRWQSATPGAATVGDSAITVNAVGVSPGTSLITVTETESGKSGDTTLTVTTAPTDGCIPGPVTGPGGLLNSAWPKLGHDNQNTYRGGAGGATGALKWVANTASNVGSASTVIGTDGTIYFGNRFLRTVLALNPSNGTTLREIQQLGNTPTLGSNGLVYASTSSGFVATDLETGINRWSLPNEIGAGNATIGADGTVYTVGFIRNSQGTFVNTVLALNGETGAQKWSVPSTNGVGILALGADGTVYAVSEGSGLNAVDGQCGTIKWTFVPDGGGFITTGPSIGSDGTIYVRGTGLGGASPQLYAVNPSGVEKWRISVTSGFSSPSIGVDGTLYLVADGRITAHDPATGAQKWFFAAPGTDAVALAAASIASDGTVYFTARTIEGGVGTSVLYALDGGTGVKKWSFTVPGRAMTVFTAPVIGPDGTVYLSDDDNGTLIAVK